MSEPSELRQAANLLRETTLIRSDIGHPLAAWLDTTADVMEWLGPVETRDGELWDAMGCPRVEWDAAVELAAKIRDATPAAGQLALAAVITGSER